MHELKKEDFTNAQLDKHARVYELNRVWWYLPKKEIIALVYHYGVK